MADGAVVPGKTVASGQITLDTAASKVHVGLPYTSTFKSMRYEAGSREGTAQAKINRVYGLALRLWQTGAGLFYGDDEQMDELDFREESDVMDSPTALFSGDTSRKSMPNRVSQDPYVRIEHRSPTPATLIAIYPKMDPEDQS